MDKEINNNGYDYVDLGLPSGTLWATKNVGANKPSDFGLYFQWGDTQGYTNEQAGKDKQFNWAEYKWNPRGDGENFTKYTTTRATLNLEDDAAHANMGGDWHMPTPTQIIELLDNTSRVWSILDGVGGMKFTSKNDESRFIFIPVAGMAWDSLVDNNEYNGNVWTSMVSTIDIDGAQSLFFDFGCCCLGNGGRRSYGFSVRGVIDKKFDKPKGKKNNMDRNLNLVEILKNVPEGTKLWSPIYGECTFLEVDESIMADYGDGIDQPKYPIICEADGAKRSFTKEGKLFDDNNDTECILFPSKWNRDWSTFKVPKMHKHFEPYQKVLCVINDIDHKIWAADFYSHYNEDKKQHNLVSGVVKDDADNEVIPYGGNEEKLGKTVEK